MRSIRNSLKLRRMVQRENAVQYMLISLLSFAASVTFVRTYLTLTGYPQIGNATLHISHVLWGGLILYIAAILPLIYLNPKVYSIVAILSGVGVGLFVDEVGKFITQQYDYFFAAAAPIIYIFFLVVVILVLMVRRSETMDGRDKLVQALEILREQLYRPLESSEKERFEREMNELVENDPDRLHQNIASNLLAIMRSDLRIPPETSPAWWLRIVERVERWLTENRLRQLLALGMLLLGLLSFKNPLQVWLGVDKPTSAILAFLTAHSGRQIAPGEAQALFNARLGLEVLVGLVFLVSAVLFVAGKKRLAISLGFLCLLVTLTVLDLLLFYFEQFSTAITVGFQFLVLLAVMHYRRKYNTSISGQDK